MRILVTGARGLLGQALLDAWRGDHEVVPTYRVMPSTNGGHVMDVQDTAEVDEVVHAVRPDWIVHTAALTDVDKCERFPSSAMWTNAVGTENVARAAAKVRAKLAYVSTAYVFDGRTGRYTEDDPADPINAYGQSKLKGERYALRHVEDALICRSSHLFGTTRANFVASVHDALERGQKVRVPQGQVVTPTWVGDLADQLMTLIEASASGVYHTAGADHMSRVAVARAVARNFGFHENLVVPVEPETLAWVAPRPRDSTLRTSKVAQYKEPEPFDNGLALIRSQILRTAPLGTDVHSNGAAPST